MPSFARSRTFIAILSATVAATWLSVSMTLADDNPNTGTVAQGEVRIEYFAQGTGPVVLLLPSLGRGAEDFDDLAKRIAQAGYRVLRPQPRGLGGSDGPLRGLTLHDYARDVGVVIARESAEPVVVVGHAFGNWVARMVAVDLPGSVRGVALLAAGTHSAGTTAAVRESILKSFDSALPPDERLRHLQNAFFAPGDDASVWLDLRHTSAAIARFELEAGYATPESEWWGAGTAPILDLQAGNDKLRPRSTRDNLRNELGDRVTIVVVPDAGHALLPEQPAAVADALVA